MKYQVILQDEYDNLYHIGFYDKLSDSIDDVNEELSIYNVSITANDLVEYPSTFGSVFDLSLSDLFEDNDSVQGVKIRGFIFENWNEENK